MTSSIDGTPSDMMRYTAVGPGPVKFAAPLVSQLNKGNLFAAAEAEAATKTAKFATDADAGLKHYTSVAHTSGAAYLDADELSKGYFESAGG